MTNESNRPGARKGNQNAARATKRKPKAYRFSEWTMQQVKELAQAKQVTVTEVFERAVDRLYQAEYASQPVEAGQEE